jgi:hypothetical protein
MYIIIKLIILNQGAGMGISTLLKNKPAEIYSLIRKENEEN